MTNHPDDDPLVERIRRELLDGYDEELEMEIEDRSVDDALDHLDDDEGERSERSANFRNLFKLQRELVKLQGRRAAR